MARSKPWPIADKTQPNAVADPDLELRGGGGAPLDPPLKCLVGLHDWQQRGRRVKRKLHNVSTYPYHFFWWRFVSRFRGNKQLVTISS